ncbi:hypothetical protein [Eubacterium pyruvativorans]|uniref:hypothetical protein n=1 Tax=Eubacterium pyruvativorans TaxID=155865 RepID=UPI000885CDCD|nr:hypothetical protein [Eubacterium pyruvativorans]SDF21221.1 hypothetical protein SAMN04487889_11346 [Eubacterium pyruvativorans]
MTGMDRNDGAWKYSDILYVRHPEPSRARMSREKRAAQFAPFAALTGYEEAVRETARETEAAPSLDEDRREELDRILHRILAQPDRQVTIVRFQPDERKEGGAYAENRGRLRRLDPQNRTLELEDGTVIPLEDVVEIRPGTDGSNY